MKNIIVFFDLLYNCFCHTACCGKENDNDQIDQLVYLLHYCLCLCMIFRTNLTTEFNQIYHQYDFLLVLRVYVYIYIDREAKKNIRKRSWKRLVSLRRKNINLYLSFISEKIIFVRRRKDLISISVCAICRMSNY